MSLKDIMPALLITMGGIFIGAGTSLVVGSILVIGVQYWAMR
jgi:hypothetical protein